MHTIFIMDFDKFDADQIVSKKNTCFLGLVTNFWFSPRNDLKWHFSQTPFRILPDWKFLDEFLVVIVIVLSWHFLHFVRKGGLLFVQQEICAAAAASATGMEEARLQGKAQEGREYGNGMTWLRPWRIPSFAIVR